MELPRKRRAGFWAFVALKYLGFDYFDTFEYRNGYRPNAPPLDKPQSPEAVRIAASAHPEPPRWLSSDDAPRL